jgi:hypothetical protein
MSLTDDDKNWIAAQFAEVHARIDRVETRTASIWERVEGRIDASEERLKDAIKLAVEASETKLLTAFHKWGRTSDTRTRQALDNVAAFNERLMALEDRVTSLEQKPAH